MAKKGRYLQVQFYVSDQDEKMILQAGETVPQFLDKVVRDAVDLVKRQGAR